MIIQPKIRGFICTTAHPFGSFQSVKSQIDYVLKQAPLTGPKKVLVIGASTGYGLASRIVPTFAAKADTIGVFFEKEADDKRTATAGWYNTAAFEKIAHEKGLYAKSINGDAFSDVIKEETANLIKRDFGQIDLLVYSLASPRRMDPRNGETYSSVLKPIGNAYTAKTIDAFKGEVKEVTIDPATDDEIAATIKVMGGEDWERWIHYLAEQNLLAKHCKTVAYSYLGPELTYPIYKEGTIGKAKEHLKQTADKLKHFLANLEGDAIVSVNKAVVTQASAAIPVVPLYISLLFKVMKEKGVHEGCIEQIYRLFSEHLYTKESTRDSEGYIRLDDLEMRADIQASIAELWKNVSTETINQIADIEGYREEFYKLFGFHFAGVQYDADVDPNVKIDSIKN